MKKGFNNNNNSNITINYILLFLMCIIIIVVPILLHKIDYKTYFDGKTFFDSKNVYQKLFINNLQEWPEYKYYITTGDGADGDYRVTTVTYFFNKDPKLADFIKSFSKKTLDDAIGIRDSKYGLPVIIKLGQFEKALSILSLNNKMYVSYEESEIKHIEK